MAAPGDLDPTFGRGGKVITNFTTGNDTANDLAIQADGKIVTAGRASGTGGFGEFALARYKPDGTLDPTFGQGGRVTTNLTDWQDNAFSVVLQVDGKIVAAGMASLSELETVFALARYAPDGTLDPTFGGDGVVMTKFSGSDTANDLAIQADGKIVAAGTGAGRFALARYKPDGTLDPAFGRGGKVTTGFPGGGASAVAIQTDSKIVAAGAAGTATLDFALARYKPDGTLDTTFSGDGKVTTDLTSGNDIAEDVAIQTDGKIVAAGDGGNCCEWTGDFGLVRYKPDGTLDPSFDGDGEVITEFTTNDDLAVGVVLQADGKIVAAGHADYSGEGSGKFALGRYNAEGTLDTTFGRNGKVITRFAGYDGADAVAIQTDGRIVAAGHAIFGESDSWLALARYLVG